MKLVLCPRLSDVVFSGTFSVSLLFYSAFLILATVLLRSSLKRRASLSQLGGVLVVICATWTSMLLSLLLEGAEDVARREILTSMSGRDVVEDVVLVRRLLLLPQGRQVLLERPLGRRKGKLPRRIGLTQTS